MGKIIGIVCVDEKWGIGKNNDLLFHLKEDMNFFRTTTTGQICAMGYNTLLSFPGSKPLPNRTNIVLAPVGVERNDCIVLHNFEEMICTIAKFTQKDDRDVYIVGGSMFYESMLPYYDKVYVTKVLEDGDAQVFFPNLDRIKEFTMKHSSAVIEDNGHKICFTTYERNDQ